MTPLDYRWLRLQRAPKLTAARHRLVLVAAMLAMAVILWAHQVVLSTGHMHHTAHIWSRWYPSYQTEIADCAVASKQLWKRPHLHPALHAMPNGSGTTLYAGTAEASTSSSSSSGGGGGVGKAATGSVGVQQPFHHLIAMPADSPMAASRQQLQQYIASPQFAAEHADMLAQQRLRNKRGILIVAGGKKLTAQLVVLLKVLREVVHCSLPVEVAWLGDSEMDGNTLEALQQHFGPLTGFNAQAVPFPLHHREVPRTQWVGKVSALLQCSLHEVLLLDCDNLPLVNPERHFADPLYQQAGNLFWPDFWGDWVKAGVWEELGINKTLVQPLLAAGAGWSGRDAESGMLLINRARWLPVLHWVFWVNTWHDRLYYKLLHGDKDTFALGFALAGQAQAYRQVAVPPGGAFQWSPAALEVKCPDGKLPSTCGTLPGWQMLGALQHDNYGHAAFFHRTINKLLLHEQPWPATLATGPLPRRWARYHLAHNSQGPTKGVHNIHAAPDSAFQKLRIDPVPHIAVAANGSSWQRLPAHLVLQAGVNPVKRNSIKWRWNLDMAMSYQAETNAEARVGDAALHSMSSATEAQDGNTADRNSSSILGCPLVTFSQYLQAVQLGLPVYPHPELECACRQLLQHVQLRGSHDDPAAVPKYDGNVSTPQSEGPQGLPVLNAAYLHGVVRDRQGNEVPDGSPVPALLYTTALNNVPSALGVIAQSHAAFHWLRSEEGKAAFPALFTGNMV